MSYGIFPPILAYLNKIEPWWLVVKNGMKRWDELERFCDGVDAAFNKVLTYLRSAISLNLVQNQFTNSDKSLNYRP